MDDIQDKGEVETPDFSVEDLQRFALGVGGFALVSMGLRGGFFLRVLALGAGAGMMYRASTGENPMLGLAKLRELAAPLGEMLERAATEYIEAADGEDEVEEEDRPARGPANGKLHGNVNANA